MNTNIKTLAGVLSLIALQCVLSPGAAAQSVNPYDGFNRPFGPYLHADLDSVNILTGDLSLHIPLVSYPQRGDDLRLSFQVGYKQPGWTATYECFFTTCKYIWTGSGVPQLIIFDDQRLSIGRSQLFCPGGVCSRGQSIFLYVAGSQDGTQHELAELGNGVLRATDASGLYGTYVASSGDSTSIDRRGISYYSTNFSSGTWKVLREDRNGNQILRSTAGYLDTIGRLIPTYVSTTDYGGCTGPLPISSAATIDYPGPSGATYRVKFCSVNVQIQTSFGKGCGPSCNVQWSGTAGNVQSIVLPNGTAWTFEYNSRDAGDPTSVNYGDLTKVTFPTGGTISYAWGFNSSCSNSSTYQRRGIISRTVDAQDGTGPHTWTYGLIYSGDPNNPYAGKVTDPLGNDTVFTGFGPACSGYIGSEKYYSGSQVTGTLLKTVSTAYSSSPNPLAEYENSPGLVNVVPIQITTTWANGMVSQVQRDYTDPGFNDLYNKHFIYGNLTAAREYDYGSGGAGTLLRQTSISYKAFANVSYLNNNLLDLLSSKTIQDGAGVQQALSTYEYDESSPLASGISTQHNSNPAAGSFRGNQTSISNWLNSGTLTCPDGTPAGSGSNVINKKTYFDTGTIASSSDPCHHIVSYLYSSTFAGALPTTETNALSQSTNYNYDFNTGLVVSATDPNNLTTSYGYDGMWRVSRISHPDGGQENITHQESVFPFTATLTKKIDPNQSLTTTNVFDGLGRITQSRSSSDPQGTIYRDTTYDALGRVASVSNPYRNGADPTTSSGITTYRYDAVGRKTNETYPDGSTLVTAYCGPSTLITDAAGKWRRSLADGIGRLIEVDEPNAIGATVSSDGCRGTGEAIWITTYIYNALGGLTKVLQNGSHQRTFTYDSLARLICSSNPESATAACPTTATGTLPAGTIQYAYNPDGTMLTKKDARNIVTTYSYDALNREISRTYSNGDSTVTTSYDQSNCLGLPNCHNIGRRTSMADGAGSEAWSFDVVDRIHKDQRTTFSSPSNVTKSTTSNLDFAGNVIQAVYPTGRVVNYTYDAANRPSTATDGSNGITYVNGWQTPPTGCLTGKVCYTPQGTFYALSIGQNSSFTGLNITHIYNNRLQPLEFKASSVGGNAMDLTYSFVDPTTGKNAGHVYSIGNTLNSSRTQSFTYDQVNRVISAGTLATTGQYCWGYQYAYDPWGNLLSQNGWIPTYNGCSEPVLGPITADGSNHISAFSYDASGNATSDGTFFYSWDAESQLKSVAGVTYNYDGDGRRVYKSNRKLYWYGASGEVLAETDGSGNTTAEYVFFGGKRIAMLPAGGNPIYYVEDLLGTARVVTTNTGGACYDADFYPYGGERPYTNTCPQNYKFEGKERDAETGNDDFGARYYSNRFGRWLSADWSSVPVPIPYANLNNPQTLNLYAMVADDPESFADLDGHLGAGGSGCRAMDGCEPGDSGTSGTPLDGLQPPPPPKECMMYCGQQPQGQSPANMTTGQFLKEEVKGVADATVMPLVNMAAHPVETIHQAFEGFSLLATHPISTVQQAGSEALTEIKQTVSSALGGNPRAIGQVVGSVALVGYTAKNVRIQRYPNAGGGGLNILNTPTRGSRIGLDVHRIPEANGGVRPHIDVTVKKPGVSSGPGSNLIKPRRHWPWN